MFIYEDSTYFPFLFYKCLVKSRIPWDNKAINFKSLYCVKLKKHFNESKNNQRAWTDVTTFFTSAFFFFLLFLSHKTMNFRSLYFVKLNNHSKHLMEEEQLKNVELTWEHFSPVFFQLFFGLTKYTWIYSRHKTNSKRFP